MGGGSCSREGSDMQKGRVSLLHAHGSRILIAEAVWRLSLDGSLIDLSDLPDTKKVRCPADVELEDR